MAKVPRFACSHTITGACTFRVASSTTHDLTVAAGTYWTDPIYSGAWLRYVDLAAAACYGIEPPGIDDVISSYVDSDGDGVCVLGLSSAHELQFLSHANVTAEGKRLLARLGIPPGTAYPAAGALSVTTRGVLGAWGPNGRAESGSVNEVLAGETGSVSVSADGTAYAVYAADPQRSRLVVLQALAGQYVLRGSRALGASGAAADYSLQTHLYDVLCRGEKVRYYADRAATYTYLTSACSATESAITLASNTGANAGDVAIVNGESMALVQNTTGTTWAVYRFAPVAHAAYEPVGMGGAWVATYLLGEDGGNVNRGEFSPSRRAVNQDRWDVEISLVRAAP